jgi:serralysin
LAASAFAANTTGLAGNADDRIIYETDTGKLFYDADGSGAGAAVQFAVLTGNPTITNADFVVV